MEALVVVAGVDVQDNRFAIRKRGWGRNGNSWGIVWKEIFGDVLNKDDPVWDVLRQELLAGIPHASGKMIYPTYVSIDAADNSELVYEFVLRMAEEEGIQVLACKGVRELKRSEDEIYREPPAFDITTEQKARKSLAERMGVFVYNVGAHKAHGEILRRINLTKLAKDRPEEYKSDLFFWNKSDYGMYEEQMTSCRKIFATDRTGNLKEVYKLIPGKRKEAMDCEKLALHAAYAAGIRNYTAAHWQQLENYYYRD
jgi:phage terminase large subunit GpA-like protein